MSPLKRLLLMSGACGVLASSISSVLAQDTTEIAEVVIVTGSYIRGSAEDAALPVDVISAEDLEKSGSPSMVDVLKNLSVSAGALGDTNQFAAGAQGTEGTGSVNLRNLGRARTLVLLNGRRLVNAPQSGSPDTNLLPLAAVGRIEVLKDGAAATYGSDAIGGVVNFITNDRLDGLELGGSYKYIEDEDGDYDSKIAFGWQGDSQSFLVAAGYQHRSELRTTDRDYAINSFAQNPQSYSSGGNPGTFILPLASAATTIQRDPGCAALGGTPGVTDTNAASCYFNFVPFDNLVEKQDQYQGYAEYNVEFGESNKLHVEGFYSETDVPQYRTSPSFLPNQTPTFGTGLGQNPFAPTGATAGLANRFIVPVNNPGVQDFIRQNPALIASLTPAAQANLAGVAGTPGVVIDLNPLFRPFGVGGNPKTGGSSNISDRVADAFRFSASLTGQVSDALKWDLGVTYMENNYLSTNNDILVSRLQTALKGFGGFNCTGVTPGQNGCLFYNPFSSAIQKNVTTGQVNPNFVPTSANTPELANYLFGKNDLDRRSTQIVVDAVFSGETGIELPGGKLAWAAGAQYREEDFRAEYSVLGNYGVNPCRDPGDRSCLTVFAPNPTPGGPPINTGRTDNALATGVFDFLGGGFDAKVSQNVYAAFTEISLPITDSLSSQIAARYEDYGGDVGSTFDPKLSVRYQATDWLAFRGSAGTSFRGPPATNLVPNSATAQQFIQQAGGFRAIRVFGNPNLEPEKATTFNFGLLVNAGGLRGSVDYFHYNFRDQLTTENFQGIITNAFTGPANMAGTPTINCASPVASRIVFIGNVPCAAGLTAANLAAVNTNIINGTGLKTDGLDFDLEYAWNDVFGGALTAGVNATYTLTFRVNAEVINGVTTTPQFDGVGFSNVNTPYNALPALKGSFFLNYNRGIQNLRLVTRFTDQYRDTRSTLDFQRNIFLARPSTGGVANRRGEIIDSYLTEDVTYLLSLPGETTLSAAVTNVFDKDPPFARLELGYDPTTASPIGRAIEIGIRKKF